MLPGEPYKLMRHQVYPIREIDLFTRNEVKGMLEPEHLSSDPLRMIIEVGKTDDRRDGSHSLVAQYGRVVGPEPYQSTPVERFRLFTKFDQVSESRVYTTCSGIGV